jgi:SulP family sulfate permease
LGGILQNIAKVVPGVALLFRYDRANWRHDALAALVVALVLIPSAIAYADLARCAPAAGLFAAVVGMVVFAFFTSSRHVVAGPDAAIALLVGAAIGPLALDDPGKAVTLAAVLALLTAAVLLLMARLRLGVAADFLSTPALFGFLNGAAVVIVGSQIGKFCGMTLKEDNTLQRFVEWGAQLDAIHRPTLIAGLICIAILTFFRVLVPRVPGAVVVFALAVVAGRLVDFSQYGMQLIGAVDLRLPAAVNPGLTPADAAPLFTAALGIALLVFSEGVVLGRTVASKHGYKIDPDQELIAFGAANVAAGLVGSFAVGASQTRTLLNDATGGRSQMVSILAAGLTAAFSLLLMPWIATIPSVAIAAILILTGVTLIDPHVYRKLWRQHRFSMVVAAATSLGVIALGVLPGIMLGVVLSLLGVLADIVRPHDALLGVVAGSSTLHDVGDDEAARTIPGLVVYRFYGPVIFANVRFFIERIDSFIEQEETPVRQVILDARAIPSIDITAAEQLADYVKTLRDRGIELVVVKAHLPLRETLQAIGGAFEDCRQYGQLHDALADFKARHSASRPP